MSPVGGATPQAIESLLADFHTGYERLHPLVNIELKDAGGAQLGDLLKRGEIEVAICQPVMPASKGGSVPNVCPGRGSEGHRLSRRRLLEVSELESEPLLLLSRGFASYTWFPAACQIAHVRPRVTLESGATQAVIALATTGHGTAVVASPVRIPDRRSI
jgi:DNA-binding transcriptional LysR family regulator